jgi:hypothetical protein
MEHRHRLLALLVVAIQTGCSVDSDSSKPLPLHSDANLDPNAVTEQQDVAASDVMARRQAIVPSNDQYWVSGQIVDREGFGVTGMNVVATIPALHKARALESFRAVTNDKGRFTLEIPRTGDFDVEITAWDPTGMFDATSPDSEIKSGDKNVRMVASLR